MREAVERNPHEWRKIRGDARIGEFVSKTGIYCIYGGGRVHRRQVNIDVGALGEAEVMILELGYDGSDQRLFNRCGTTLKISEALGDFFLKCDVPTSRTEGIPNDHPITPS